MCVATVNLDFGSQSIPARQPSTPGRQTDLFRRCFGTTIDRHGEQPTEERVMFKSESRAGKEVADSAIADEYVTAKQAMQILNVNAQTLYAYVSRKGIRSRPVPGTRQRLYWKSDLEQIGRKQKSSNAVTHAGLVHESGITL